MPGLKLFCVSKRVCALFQYSIRRIIVSSRKDLKAWDRVLKCSYRFEILQAHGQQCYRGACQISERSDDSKHKSRGFETSRDLSIRRLIGYWNRAQVTSPQITSAIVKMSSVQRQRIQYHQHIDAETKWPPFLGRHFWIHFRGRKSVYFYWNCTEVCSQVIAG